MEYELWTIPGTIYYSIAEFDQILLYYCTRHTSTSRHTLYKITLGVPDCSEGEESKPVYGSIYSLGLTYILNFLCLRKLPGHKIQTLRILKLKYCDNC